jgi:hypothetical protein
MPALQLRDNKTNRQSSWDSQQDFPAAYLMSWPDRALGMRLVARDLTDDRRDENSTWVYVPCPSLFHLGTRVLLVLSAFMTSLMLAYPMGSMVLVYVLT